jgi:outer membrane immunogenic protein
MRHTLKTLALAAGVSVVALSTGFAADLGARPVYKAPVAAAPMYTWTGFYVGAHVGGAFGSNDFSGSFGSPGNDSNGFIGGGQVGADYQFAPNWLIGVEGQFSGASIDESTISAGNEFKNKIGWLSSVTGRLGYVANNVLIYGKAGGAFADYKTTIGGIGDSDTRTGWTAGGGLEYMFSPQWSAKVEYQYYDFGKDSYTAVGFPYEVDSNIHTVKAGINWRFGNLGLH